MKIGILTFQNALNYGALLQAFALQEKCKEYGNETYIINYQNVLFNELYRERYTIKGKWLMPAKIIKLLKLYVFHFSYSINERSKNRKLIRFAKENFNLTKECDQNSVALVVQDYDAVIVGSDQVWNTPLTGYDKTYFLGFIEKPKKYSYAASFGKDYLSGFEVDLIKKNITKYANVSVREQQAADMIYAHTGVHSNVVLDPTLLHNAMFWSKQMKHARPVNCDDYILIYVIQKQKHLIQVAEKLAEKHNLKIIALSPIDCKADHKVIMDASVEDFLYYVAHARYVLATSYHGIVFSIIFHKEFYYELADYKPNNNSRIIDLMGRLCLQDREVKGIERLTEAEIDWVQVESKLQLLRNNSEGFLKGVFSE